MKNLTKPFRRTRLYSAISLTFISSMAWSQDNYLEKYDLPDAMRSVLEQGLSVPIVLKYAGEAGSSNTKAADAVIVLKDNQLSIQEVHLTDDGPKFNEATTKLIEGLSNKQFNNEGKLHLAEGVVIAIDVKRFVLQMDVQDQSTFEVKKAQGEAILPPSSSDKLSAVVNYDVGMYHDRGDGGNNTSNYLNYSAITSYKENNVTVNGSLYNIGKGNGEQGHELNSVVFERDVNGYRIAASMGNGWNLQTLGVMSAVNADKAYGVSFGNQSRTINSAAEQSLTPVTAFLSEPGVVNVYREGRLLSTKNFSIGSYEIDTSNYPMGSYDVEVEVVVNGEKRSTTTQRVNKMYSALGSGNKLNWDVYAGYLKGRRVEERNVADKILEEYTSSDFNNKENTHLVGVSLAKSFTFGGSNLSVNNSTYVVGSDLFNENNLSLSMERFGSLNLSTLLSGKGSYRYMGSYSVSLNKYLSMYVNNEKSHYKEDISQDNVNSIGYGGSLNMLFNNFNLGYLNFSQSRNRHANSINSSLTFSRPFFLPKLGALNLQAGWQQDEYKNTGTKNNKKYISLNMSIPLGKNVRVGLSSNNGDVDMNMSASKNFNQGFIRSVGANLSTNLYRKEGSKASNFNIDGNTSFENKYVSGYANIGRPSNGRLVGSMSARGSVAITGQGAVASGVSNNAGVMVKTKLSNKASMMAEVNGQNFKLTNGNNFLPLSPFQTYTVKLMNDVKSEDSVSIVTDRVKKVTLYPGNVIGYAPEIKQMVTVFGRLVDDNGIALANKAVKNHIGQTITDDEGSFAIDVDTRYPQLNLSEADQKQCDVKLDFNNVKGVLWLGEVSCFKLAQNKNGKFVQQSKLAE